MTVGLLMDTQRKRKLWYVHGKAYDLQTFMNNHPGGEQALVMARGLNATELFETYHFARTPPEWLLEKYRVSEENKNLDQESLKIALRELESLSEEEKKNFSEKNSSLKKMAFMQKSKLRRKIILSRTILAQEQLCCGNHLQYFSLCSSLQCFTLHLFWVISG